jgi:glycosyltransferase involved in cell wall biosynthesis
MKSSVDVVIPCYNYARYLRGCVRSVFSQPDVDVRVLVIDDASSDESALVGEELAAEYKTLTFRRHAENKGHIATYNEGLLGWSTADYTVLLSADDLLAPGSLSRAVRVMEDDKTIGMVYGPTVHFGQESELPVVKTGAFLHTRWAGAEWLETRCRAGYNVITSPEVVVRGSIQRSVGGYNPALPHAGDLEMWLRIAAVSNIAYVRRTPQAFYRVHGKSMMRTIYKGSFVDLRQRKGVFDSFFENHRSTLKNYDLVRKMASQALAKEALWDACRAYDRDEVELCQANELEEFAMETYAEAKYLPEYSALLRRRHIGPKLCHRTQVFAAPAIVRKVQRWALKERWKRSGI